MLRVPLLRRVPPALWLIGLVLLAVVGLSIYFNAVLTSVQGELPTGSLQQKLGALRLAIGILLAFLTVIVALVGVLIGRREQADARAAEASRRLKDALNSISDGFALYDADERLVLCNQRYRDLFPAISGLIKPGVRFEDVVRANVAAGSLQMGQDSNAREKWIVDRLGQFRKGSLDMEIEALSGRWIRMHDRRTQAGDYVVVRTDISELKNREAAAHESEARYRQLVEHSSSAILVHRDDKIVYANGSAARLLGAESPAWLLGLSYLDFIPESYHDWVLERYRQMEATNQPTPVVEALYRRLDGQLVDIEVRGMPLVYEGKPSVLVIAYDITARKRAEEHLRLSQLSIDRASEGMHWVDSEGRVINVNEAACRLLGYTREEYLKLTVFDINPAVTHENWMAVWFSDKTAGVRGFEGYLKAKDGRLVPVDVMVNHLEFENVEYNFTLLRDATERRERERELREAKEQAEAASRAKSEFLANMSHELRTPLNAIIGFSEVMRNELLGPLGNARYAEYATDIYESGSHLLNLINDILDVSRAEAGELKLHESELDLEPIIQSAQRLVEQHARAAGLTLEAALPDALPTLWADERMVKQMLINLLSNAVKFTPEGGRICVKVEREKGGGLALKVVDTGIGMAPEDIPVALTPFRQVESSLTRKHGGTGLGLPLVKSLIELHGGSLKLESQPSKGTTVTLSFPPSRLVIPVDSVGGPSSVGHGDGI